MMPTVVGRPRNPVPRPISPRDHLSGHIAAGMRPTVPRKRYLVRALTQPRERASAVHRRGREVSKKPTESCIGEGGGGPGARGPPRPEKPCSARPPPPRRVLARLRREPPAERAAPAAVLTA